MIHALDPASALVYGPRYDVLAAKVLLDDFDAMPAADRNIVRWTFLNPRAKVVHPQWELVAGHVAAALRHITAERPADPLLTQLVGEMVVASPAFARHWSAYDLYEHGHGSKLFFNETVGELTLRYETLAPAPATTGRTSSSTAPTAALPRRRNCACLPAGPPPPRPNRTRNRRPEPVPERDSRSHAVRSGHSIARWSPVARRDRHPSGYWPCAPRSPRPFVPVAPACPPRIKVFAADTGSRNLTVYDTRTTQLLAGIPVQTAPVGIAMAPGDDHVYVAYASDGTVTVIDTATNAPRGDHPGRDVPGRHRGHLRRPGLRGRHR